ncbi:MAG: replicative DNA helicase [Oscillospiraceae bacterium]|nr:replicative DNA helicase [Oscillospiraceae bacterium]
MDELRRLPHNIEAEQAVIGSMLLDPRCLPDVIELLDRDDFYLPAHQSLFDAIYIMFSRNEAFDPVMLMGKMREMGTFEENSTNDYLNRLLDNTPTAAHVKHYAVLVRQQSLLRKLDNAAAEISLQSREPGAAADDVLDNAEQSVFNIRQGREVKHLHNIPSVLMDVYANIRELSDAGGKLPGISSGIAGLDDHLGGLLNSNLILVASRPAMGKTSFLLNIGLHAARAAQKAVVFFSLEMSREQLVTRLLSAQSKVKAQSLLTGNLNNKDWEEVGKASLELSQLQYFFNDNPAISVGEMKSQCRRVQNLGLVVIDYLQLMQGSKDRRFDNRTSEVGDISRSLKIMAKELGVPILCASQLSRATVQRSDKRPMLSDLRESGAIEQDADAVMFLHRESYYDENAGDPNEAELIIAKNRHGRTGTVELYWSGDITTFTQRENIYND